MTITLKKKSPLVVPPSIQRKARLKTGDQIEFKASPGIITIITKSPMADDEYTPAQRRIIDREIAKGLRDIKEGRTYGPFNTAEEMAASMEVNIKKLRRAKRPRPGR